MKAFLQVALAACLLFGETPCSGGPGETETTMLPLSGAERLPILTTERLLSGSSAVARPLETQTGEQAQEGHEQPGVPCHQIVSQATEDAKEHDQFFSIVVKPLPESQPLGQRVTIWCFGSVTMPARYGARARGCVVLRSTVVSHKTVVLSVMVRRKPRWLPDESRVG
jgi:hypothetical protein